MRGPACRPMPETWGASLPGQGSLSDRLEIDRRGGKQRGLPVADHLRGAVRPLPQPRVEIVLGHEGPVALGAAGTPRSMAKAKPRSSVPAMSLARNSSALPEAARAVSQWSS
jgi:hypothetical protein